jgi:ABC-type Fe3+ transport system permease subunit
MGGEVLILISMFLVVFGIFYLYFTTRNKERLALIEKGADASIFVKGKRENAAPFWKILILNFALLLIGIGLAIFIASILVNAMGLDDEVAYPGTIFLMAGIGLYVGFTMTKKLEDS